MGWFGRGHERVLKGASPMHRFFWESDQKCRLADICQKLERVPYESRLRQLSRQS